MRNITPKSDSVAVVDKTLDLIECLSDGRPQTVTELCEATGITKAAAYRILHTLERRGFVVTYERVRRYTIGHAFLAYTEAARHSDRLLAAARPVMHEIWRYSGETVNLGIRSQGRVLYLEIIESSHGLRATGQVGALDALHSTALGKAMLSRLLESDVHRIVNRGDFLPRTERTATDLSALIKAIRKVRSDGFAVDDEENEIGMRCVATPIVNAEGWPLGAVSVSGPTSRMTAAVVEALAVRLRVGCALIVESLASANRDEGTKTHPVKRHERLARTTRA
jgi:IclR family transcriptional regulator, acetate operon repressor